MAKLNRYIFSFLPLLTLTTSSILLSTTASAERVLEEVIVTATKREQSINDIPVAVSAYGGETLRNSGVRDVGQIIQVNPSVSFGTTESSSSGTMSIRGIGTLGTDPGLESSVGVFIDGVYRNRSGVAIDELGEIERIEVLRGPQGSLFGRNTSAGLIHVITKGPNFEENEGAFAVTLGNYNLKRIEGSYSGPIDDTLAGRVDAVITKRDGLIDDLNGGDDLNDRDRFMLRGQLAWDVSDDVSARFIADLSERKELCCGTPTSANSANFGGEWVRQMGGLEPDTDPYDYEAIVTPGRDRIDETDQWGVSAEVNWKVNDTMDAVSITSYRDWRTYIGGDLDFSGSDLFYYPKGNSQERGFTTITQELRLQGAWERGKWLVGFFFADETLETHFTATYGTELDTYMENLVDDAADGTIDGNKSAAAGTYRSGGVTNGNFFIAGQGVEDDATQEGQSFALFTQNDFDLTDNLLLTVGLRYTYEKKDIEIDTSQSFAYIPGGGGGTGGNPCVGAASTLAGGTANPLVQLICGVSALTNPGLNNGGATSATYKADRNDEEVTGTIKLAYTLPDDTLVFFNAARGFKGGGFNQSRLGLVGTNPAANLNFDREMADTLELGVKTYFFERTMAMNATLFYTEIEGFQLGQFNGATLVTTSIDQVDVQGAEVELTWQATETLRLMGGVTYVDNFYPGSSNIDRDSGVTNCATQVCRAGERRSTDWIATAGMLWMQPLNEHLLGTVYIDGRYSGAGSTNSSLAPNFDRGSYTVFNGRFGISDMARTWTVELWAQNMLNEEYTPIQFDPPPFQGSGGNGRITDFVGEQRTFGVTARKYF